MRQVEFITVEDSFDQVVAFAIAPDAANSLMLIRTPAFEPLLPPESRGVNVSLDIGNEQGLLLSVCWGADRVSLKAQLQTFELDISGVVPEEIHQAKQFLKKMLAESRGDFINA